MEFWLDLVKTAWDCGIFDRILLKGGLFFFLFFLDLCFLASLLFCFSAFCFFCFSLPLLL